MTLKLLRWLPASSSVQNLVMRSILITMNQPRNVRPGLSSGLCCTDGIVMGRIRESDTKRLLSSPFAP